MKHTKPSYDELEQKISALESELENCKAKQTINYHHIIDRIHKPIAVIDTEYRYRLVNKPYCEHFQKNNYEIIGRKANEFVGNKDFNEIIRPHVDKCLKGQELSFEYDFLSVKTKEVIRLELNYYPYYESDGSISGVISTGKDITTQSRLRKQSVKNLKSLKQKNDELFQLNEEYKTLNEEYETTIEELKEKNAVISEKEERFRSLFNQGTNGIFVHDFNGKIIEANQKLLDMLQYDYDEIRTRSIIDSLPDNPETINTGKAAFEEVKTKGKTVFETRLVRKNGDEFIAEVHSSIINLKNKELVQGIVQDITQRKQMEQALQKSEKKYRLLIENQTDLVVHVDNDGKFLFVSPSYCRLFEKKESDLLGKTFMPLVHEDDKQHTANAMKKLYKPPYHVYIEQRALTKKGWRWLGWNDTAVQDKNGNITGVIGVGRDITQRKQAEIALSKSEDKYRTILETISDGFFTLHTSNLIVKYFNRAAGKLLGRKSKEVLGKPLFDAFPEAKGSIFEEKYRVAYQNQKSLSFEVYFGEKPYENWYDVRVYASKQTLSVFFQVTTERKKAEIALQEREERFRQLAENIQEVFWISSPDWSKIFYISKTYEKMWGLSCQSLYNNPQSWMDSIVDDDKPSVINDIEKRIAGDFSKRAFNEYRIRHSDGSTRWILAKAFPIYNKEGKLYRIAGIADDITERKLAEDEIRKFKTISNRAVHGNAIVDLTGTIIYINKAFADAHGYTPEELLGKKLSLFHSKQQMVYVNEINKTLFDKGYYNAMEVWHIHKDGTEFPMLMSGVLIRDDNHKPVYMAASAIDLTKQKHAEEELKLSENKFRSITENAVDFIFIKNIQREYTFVNKAMQKLLGLSQEQILGKKPRDIFGKEQQQVVEDIDNRTFNGQTVHETRPLLIEGKAFYFNTIQTPLTIENGNVTSIMGVVRDITDYKQAEKALKESEERFKLAMQATHDGLWDWNYVTNEIYYSPGWKRMLGYEDDELENKFSVWEELTHPEDVKRAWKTIDEHISGKRDRFYMELRMKHKKGHWVDILSRANAIFDKNNKPVRVVGTYVDISERKKADEALRKSEERYRFVTDNIEEFIFMISPEGNLTFASGNVEKVFNINNKKFINKNIKSLMQFFNMSDEQQEAIFKQFAQALQQKKSTVDYEFYYHINDEVQYFYCFEKLIYNQQGRYDGAIGVIRNITDRKNAEIELKNKNEEYLAVNEELRQINEELKKAKERAEEGDRLKSAFLANMSHEIRTPMNGIIGFSEMLAEPGLSDSRRKYYAEIVQNSSHRLLVIVNNILDISKIETGQMEVEISETSVNEIITETFIFFKAEAINKNISIYPKKSLPQEQSIINTDDGKLRQILNNLMNNALKYTTQGYIEFGYNLKNDNLEFYVKDTGIGITPEYHENIFERFRQGKNQTTKLNCGTGLGLSICKSLVQLLGGKIGLQSEPNKGSLFYFTIPYNPVYPVAKETPHKSNDKADSNRSFTILIAEDEEVNYLYFEELLSTGHFKLLHAKNGREAIKMYEENPDICLVFMDIKMPVMNGYEATMYIKQKNPQLPVIAQTAYAFPADKEKALKTGCDDYIAKPIKKNELYHIINKYIKNC